MTFDSDTKPQFDSLNPPTTPPRVEGQYLGSRLTPEGRFELRWLAGEESLVDPLNRDLTNPKELHKKFRDKHRQVLGTVMEVLVQFKKNGRVFPILREELLDLKIDKQLIKDLVQFGYLDQQTIPVEAGKRKLGGLAVITPTLEARKLYRAIERAMRDEIEKNLTQQTEDHGAALKLAELGTASP